MIELNMGFPDTGAVKAIFVIGTRAQLIKVAPVVVACQDVGLPVLLLMTGQHRETMQDLLNEFGIFAPQEMLMPEGERATVGSLLYWLPRAYLALKARLRDMRKAYGAVSIVVHGDTASTVVGALAALRTGHRVLHLESGLSSGRLFDPFPEELSRRLVFRWADVAFCPNPEAAEYMKRRYRCQVIQTRGNTIVDAVRLAKTSPDGSGSVRPYMVVSLHRFQNIFSSARLHALVQMVEAVSSHLPVHFVLHPATRKRLAEEGLLARLESRSEIHLSPRLGYRAFLSLAANAACVLTDGGSNQEELSILGVPTIIMRERTERPDGLGRNAIMEADVSAGVVAYIQESRFQLLRQPCAVPSENGPSQIVARYLASDQV